MAHLLISAAHKSSGKTIVSLGICAALQQRNLKVQPFKKGPDYIDPLWLAKASQTQCYNLDFYQMREDEIKQTFQRYNQAADISIIEGNKGLHDGLALDGSNSNAALAKLLTAPVVLVLDTHGITRGIAPLVKGYQDFDREINIAGIILNKVASPRHESKLLSAIEYYTDIPIIGVVHKNDRLTIHERHLGLIPSNESKQAQSMVNVIAEIISDQVDLDRLLDIGQQAPSGLSKSSDKNIDINPGTKVRIGVASDEAFGFYYADDLESLQSAGADIVYIDMLRDGSLPEVDGLFIGGGFPEVFMKELAGNNSLKSSVLESINRGLPVYAECGGLMYLSRSISWDGKSHKMVGALPLDIIMHDKPKGRGYVRLTETVDHPWPANTDNNESADILAHEFHYSDVMTEVKDLKYAYRVQRGHGIDGKHDGIVYKNVLASYSHLRHTGGNNWTRRFVDFIKKCSHIPREQRHIV